VTLEVKRIAMIKAKEFLVPFGKKFRLRDHDPGSTGGYKSKGDALADLEADTRKLGKLQDVLYAQDSYALLVVIQGMDASGKDSAIKNIMSGVNPQGCQVTSFKAPSAEELDHDYLWRCQKAVPARGNIGIFNRSHYEEVLVARVVPEVLRRQKLPAPVLKGDIWKTRFKDISNYEKYLAHNGIVILKFFLNVSRMEQKKRFLQRIDRPDKNWKYSADDVAKRRDWKAYMEAYEDMLGRTSKPWAPWYIIPADNKWFSRVVIASLMVKTLEGLKLSYPELTAAQKKGLAEAKRTLAGD
jgi:PPK2 family polyphosphate:nucleotide phosphotransferase